MTYETDGARPPKGSASLVLIIFLLVFAACVVAAAMFPQACRLLSV